MSFAASDEHRRHRPTDAIVSKTLDGTITSWNAGAARIFGYSEAEMIGANILKIIPPELHSEEAQVLARIRRGERIDHYETARVAKDGRRVDISLTVSPLRDRNGAVFGASKVARDITDKKHVEKSRLMLMGELSHRVKNTLATVQAIADAGRCAGRVTRPTSARRFTGPHPTRWPVPTIFSPRRAGKAWNWVRWSAIRCCLALRTSASRCAGPV